VHGERHGGDQVALGVARRQADEAVGKLVLDVVGGELAGPEPTKPSGNSSLM
jgi:hypothetical protein